MIAKGTKRQILADWEDFRIIYIEKALKFAEDGKYLKLTFENTWELTYDCKAVMVKLELYPEYIDIHVHNKKSDRWSHYLKLDVEEVKPTIKEL